MGDSCDGSHRHDVLKAEARTPAAEDYPSIVATTTARVTMEPEFGEAYKGEGAIADVKAASQRSQPEGARAHLQRREKLGTEAPRYVKRLRRNRGRPNLAVLRRLPQQAGARGKALNCAAEYRRERCAGRRRPPKPPTAGAKQPVMFNEVVYSGVFCARTLTRMTAALSMELPGAARYGL